PLPTLNSGLSADGSTLLAGKGGSLVTSAGTWSFGGAYGTSGDYYILLNGQSAAIGHGTELEVANQGNLYHENFWGNWYEWTAGSWTSVSDPGAVPTTSGGSGGGTSSSSTSSSSTAGT